MNEDTENRHKIERLERKLEESNSISECIFSIFLSILASGLLASFNPLVIPVLFFVIYGVIQLTKN